MTSALRLGIGISVGVHAAALIGWPGASASPVVFDVERAPMSVEIVLLAPKPAVVQTPIAEPSRPREPEPTPKPLEPSQTPSQTVVIPEQRGAISEMLPSHLRNPAPVYPRLAQERGEEGTVVVDVEVLASGRSGAVSVARSSGSMLLDEAARKAVRQWQFRPAHRQGRAVAVTVEIPITFRLIDAD